MMYGYAWDTTTPLTYAWSILPIILIGLTVTLKAAAAGFAIALGLGLVFAMLRRSRFRSVSWTTACIVEFLRDTPLLVQLFFLYYVLPDYGVTLPAFLTGALALGLQYSAYTSEVYRGGIEAVPRGQWEAAKATNLTTRQTWLHVVLPQAVPPMIPAMANYLLAMFKETPLLSAITVLELMNQAKSVANSSYRYVEPMTLVGVMFLVVSLISVVVLRWLERRYGRISR